MKNIKSVIMIATITSALVAPLSYADINEDLQNICTIVKNNDKGELRKKMRTVRTNYRLRLGDYYSGISCGGDSLIRYSMENNSVDVGTYMIKKMSKRDLKKQEKDGLALQQWAQQKGYMSSAIGKELTARLN